jgi:hypothetical protein
VTDTAAARVAYFYGFSGSIGAGTYDRSDALLEAPDALVPAATSASQQVSITGSPVDAIWEITDSATYGPIDDVSNVVRLALRAWDQERPYVRLSADWVLTASASVEATLTLDGIWFGASGAFSIVVRGAWTNVTIAHCTLDPGGGDVDGNSIEPVNLVIEGQIDELVIDHCIIARIVVPPGGVVDRIVVRDSIVQAPDGVPAIALAPGDVVLQRVTVFGAVDVERLDASEALITGPVDVTDTQNGCFRFSAAPAGSRLPRPYRAVTLVAAGSLFTSRSFGHWGYAQLSESAPGEIARGAENGSEIGAFSSLLNPIKLDSLAHKVDEYLPFGLIPCFIRAT